MKLYPQIPFTYSALAGYTKDGVHSLQTQRPVCEAFNTYKLYNTLDKMEVSAFRCG